MRVLVTGADGFLGRRLVEIAEPNTWGEWTLTPDDSIYASQWHHPIMSSEAA